MRDHSDADATHMIRHTQHTPHHSSVGRRPHDHTPTLRLRYLHEALEICGTRWISGVFPV